MIDRDTKACAMEHRELAMKLSGWGKYPLVSSRSVTPETVEELAAVIATGRCIARGNGRAYGDSAVGSDITVKMRKFNKFIAFDDFSGQITVEAGVLLSEILDVFVPKGWFPYVTPGTKFVSVGGLIAADVHGKNHHKEGSFSKYVDWIDLVCHDGKVRRCSPDTNKELFLWTFGGMGLTGVILRAAFRLRPIETSWIRQGTSIGRDFKHAMELFESNSDATYSVAWIDCLKRGKSLGRSLVLTGEHADLTMVSEEQQATRLSLRKARKINIPFNFPSWCLNKYTVSAFNECYYAAGRVSREEQLVYWDKYFYPLDSVLNWNRIYGRSGFAQFQCVIPIASAEYGIRDLLESISAAGSGSFLAVLKRFGHQESKFSFPTDGYTLALDFPVSAKSLELMKRLDRITLDHGGRFYLAKDSRMSADVFSQSDKRANEYRIFLDSIGVGDSFSSSQSVRLGL